MAGQVSQFAIFRCGLCDFESENQQVVEEHIALLHTEHEDESEGYSEPATGGNSLMSDDKATDQVGGVVGNEEGFKFNTASTRLLISLIASHIQEFDSPTVTRKAIYENVAEAMECSGYHLTWQQVKDKWAGLKRTYKQTKDETKSSGNGRRKWLFWNDMDSVLRHKIISNLGAVASNQLAEESSDQTAIKFPQLSDSLLNSGSASDESDAQAFEDDYQQPAKRQKADINWEAYLEKREIRKRESLAEKKKFNMLFAEFLQFIKSRDNYIKK